MPGGWRGCAGRQRARRSRAIVSWPLCPSIVVVVRCAAIIGMRPRIDVPLPHFRLPLVTLRGRLSYCPTSQPQPVFFSRLSFVGASATKRVRIRDRPSVRLVRRLHAGRALYVRVDNDRETLPPDLPRSEARSGDAHATLAPKRRAKLPVAAVASGGADKLAETLRIPPVDATSITELKLGVIMKGCSSYSGLCYLGQMLTDRLSAVNTSTVNAGYRQDGSMLTAFIESETWHQETR